MEGRLEVLTKPIQTLGFTTIIGLTIVANAFADKVNGEWYSTARALGMGNAAIANVDDPAAAMFYNPAGIARNRKLGMELLNPQLEVGVGNTRLSNKTTALLGQTSLQKTDPNLQKNPEVPSYMGYSLYPNIYAQNFGLGVLVRYETGAYRRRVTNQLLYHSRFLVLPTMAMGFGIFNGMMKFGFAAHVVQITENDIITSSYKNTGYFAGAAEGAGLALDAGYTWTFPVTGLPTLGFVARNAGDTSFPSGTSMGIGDTPSNRHDSVKMTYDSGFSIAPKLGRRSAVTLALDYRDIGNKTNTMAGRKINFGTEFDLNHWVFIRAGARAGYWSAGLGFSGKSGTFDLGTYADELDPQKFMEVSDRRVFFRYGGRF